MAGRAGFVRILRISVIVVVVAAVAGVLVLKGISASLGPLLPDAKPPSPPGDYPIRKR